MRKSDSAVDAMKEIAKELGSVYTKFEPWLEKRRLGKARKGRFFDLCVRSAISKLFDFNKSIVELAQRSNAIPAYFVAGSLRGICEDLIILGALQDVRNSRRDRILQHWIAHETLTNLLTQTSFFRKNRPSQSILTFSDKTGLQKRVRAMQRVWRGLGFALSGDRIAPSTWSLAKKAALSEVYEFLYRFSCDIVHFNPAVLLRFGWGVHPTKPRFAAKNFDLYYVSFGLVYGAYLWCLFLQVLRGNLRCSKGARRAEKELVKWLNMLQRWPEIVTREEMNIPQPRHGPGRAIAEIAVRLFHAEKRRTIIRRRRT